MVSVKLYDECSVELTKEGAEFINSINSTSNALLENIFIDPSKLNTDYKKGDIFCNNLIMIAEIYLKTHELGLKEPYIDGTIQVLTN